MLKSKLIKAGIQKSFESGTSKIADKICYGYSKAPDGSLPINEKEAQIVRFIFASYIAGDSLGKIVDVLTRKKALSPSGKDGWSRKAVDGLLSNEKYVGQVLLQKTIIQDGQQVKNNTDAQYLLPDHHPAIISRESFEAVQAEKARRSNLETTESGSKRKATKYNSSNVLSGLLICEECGSPYRRITRSGGEVVWRCASRVEHGKKYCKNSPTVSQQHLENVLFKTFGVFPPDQGLLRKVAQRITVTPDGLRVDLAEMDDITRSIFLRRQEYQFCQAYLFGDTRALEYLFEWNYPLLRRYVFSISRRSFLKEEDKEDVIQNAALKSICLFSIAAYCIVRVMDI